MTTRTDFISAQIMSLLVEKKRPLNIEEIFFYLDEPVDIIYMSLGSLMRENRITWGTRNNQNWIQLAKETADV